MKLAVPVPPLEVDPSYQVEEVGSSYQVEEDGPLQMVVQAKVDVHHSLMEDAYWLGH